MNPEKYEKAQINFFKGLESLDNGDLLNAEKYFTESLVHIPNRISTITNLITTLIKLENLEKAEKLLLDSMQQYPNDPLLHLNNGILLSKKGNLKKALIHYDTAIEIDPLYAEAFNNKGLAFKDLNKLDEALISFTKAIKINPKFENAYVNMGNTLILKKNVLQALDFFEKAMTLKEDCEFAMGNYIYAKLNICDWSDIEKYWSKLSKLIYLGKRVIGPFALLSLTDNLEIHRLASITYSKITFPLRNTFGEIKINNNNNNKIKIAFMSADYAEHPMAYNFVGFFENIDKSKFETFAISYKKIIDNELTRRLKSSFDYIKLVEHMSDEEVCMWMRHKNIDIAVDMMGPTLNNRQGIFALRCAPIQVNQFSWCSGSEYMDFIIADKTSIPDKYSEYYVEKIAYMPKTLFATDNKRKISTLIPSRKSENLPQKGIVLCCFNNSHKITPQIFNIWMNILKIKPDSVLWLRETNSLMVKNLRKEASNRGIEPNRLIFAKKIDSMEEHLARYKLADIFVDTFPFCAQTTASDALWAGLPLVTIIGQSSMSRICASMLIALDSKELIAETLTEYERKILEYVYDINKLNELKIKIEKNRIKCDLFNTKLYTRNIEKLYLKMHESSLH